MRKKYSSLLLPLLLAACASQTNTTDIAQNTADVTQNTNINQHSLTAYHWQLVSAQDKHNKALPDFQATTQSPMQLEFHANRLNLNGGCNSITLSYTLQNNTLTAGNTASTMMACPRPLGQRDWATSKFLAATNTLNLSEDTQAPVLLMQDTHGNRLTWQGTPTGETRYGSKPVRVFLEVKPQTRTCTGAHGPQTCLQVREIHYNAEGLKTRQGKWQNFSDPISGYHHDSAQQQILRVNRYTVSHPAADQSRYAWELDTIIESKEAH